MGKLSNKACGAIKFTTGTANDMNGSHWMISCEYVYSNPPGKFTLVNWRFSHLTGPSEQFSYFVLDLMRKNLTKFDALTNDRMVFIWPSYDKL